MSRLPLRDPAAPLRLAFVAEGDANTRDCWSGCGQGFVSALRRTGAVVDVVNAELRGWNRWMAAATSWHPDRRRWRQRFTLGDNAAARKARIGALALHESGRGAYDAVIQAGATFDLPRSATGGALRVVYADANISFAYSGRPFSGVSSLAPEAVERIAQRERRIYDGVDRIWPWSDALRRSFIEDFGQPDDKLATLYAGANVMPEGFSRARDRQGPPMILFVGKDHSRKGSATLLTAFSIVRAAMPTAELHFVGAIPDGSDAPGVTAHGVIDTSRPEGRDELRSLYQRASVFCLPSRYEPFGVVFVEAMLMELPCIGSNRWAMPEIIEEGITGWLAPDGDARALAEVLLRALADPERAMEMGRRGRERALALFTWDRVAARAVADLEQHLDNVKHQHTRGIA